MPTIPVATLEQLTRDVFTARDVPTDDAAWVATLLVRANCRGHDSHGVIRVPHYVRAMKAGEVNPRPKIAVEGLSSAPISTPATTRITSSPSSTGVSLPTR